MRELTAELMTGQWRPTGVRLSPDGRLVAWVATPYAKEGEHAESAIWVAPVDGSQPARRWTYGGADCLPTWSPDGAWLAFLSDRAKRGTNGLYVMPADGAEARPLVVRTRAVGGIAWSPHGDRIAFLAPDEPTEEDQRREKERDDADVRGVRWQRQRLRVVHVETGEVSEINSPGTSDIHFTEVAWSPDGGWIACVAQPTPESDALFDTEIVLLPAGGGDARRLCRVASAFGLAWTADGMLVFCGFRPPQAMFGATAWSIGLNDTAPREMGARAGDPRCCIDVRVASGATTAAVHMAEGLESRIELRDAAGDLLGILHRCRGALTSFDVAGNVLAVVEASDDRLPEVHAGCPGALHPRSDHHAELREVRFGTVEEFHWRAPDGEDLDGVVVYPPDPPPGPLPAVVLPHGGPYGRSVPARELGGGAWSTWLAAAGYVALLPNYRGGLGRGQHFAAAARGGVGGIEFSDVMSMVEAAVERGIADPARLGIAGWSQGGFLAAWAVTQIDRFRAAVVGAGVTDWHMMASTSDLPRLEIELAGSRPWDGPSARRAAERSPITYAARVRTPVLILHGREDERVPVSQAIGFERALRACGAEVELVTYPREGHSITEVRHQRDVLRRVYGWFERWLGSDGESSER